MSNYSNFRSGWGLFGKARLLHQDSCQTIQDWRSMFVSQAEETRRDYLVLSNQLSLAATFDPPLIIIQDWRSMFVSQAMETRRDFLVLSNQLSLSTTLLSIHIFPSQESASHVSKNVQELNFLTHNGNQEENARPDLPHLQRTTIQMLPKLIV